MFLWKTFKGALNQHDLTMPASEKAHEKGSGFGLVTIDTKAKTYTLEAFRFLCDATAGNPEDQFPGWPVTIHQEENQGRNRVS